MQLLAAFVFRTALDRTTCMKRHDSGDAAALCRATDPVGWLQHQKKKWRAAAAARAKRKKAAVRAQKRGRGPDEDLQDLSFRGKL